MIPPAYKAHQTVSFSGFRCFDIHLWISFTPNAAILFVDVAIQPEVRFIAKQNSLMKIGNNGNLVLGPFDESTPCLMIVLMNCQTKLRINHLTAVKSVVILEISRIPSPGSTGLHVALCFWARLVCCVQYP
ncbi:adhesion G protein-coupled receptor B2 [Trichonephila clavipes]|nr:adhesion G protein-coupled receptor B2 [Trichonephila clavipes]